MCFGHHFIHFFILKVAAWHHPRPCLKASLSKLLQCSGCTHVVFGDNNDNM